MNIWTEDDFRYLSIQGSNDVRIAAQCGWHGTEIDTGNIHLVTTNSQMRTLGVVDLNTRAARLFANQIIDYCDSLEFEADGSSSD